MWIPDWTFILIIPAMLFALIAQARVSTNFKKYSKVKSRSGKTGAEIAREMLLDAGIHDVAVESIRGNLTDHYDPRTKTLRLSESVHGSDSLAAAGVAAHETGHAIQHYMSYSPLGIRSAIVPVVGIGSKIAWPIFFVGLLLTQFDGDFGWILIQFGIVLFALTVVFSFITLPVEFNASKRAVKLLSEHMVVSDDEMGSVKKVLNAASMTYVAAAAVAVMQLLRLILIANRRR